MPKKHLKNILPPVLQQIILEYAALDKDKARKLFEKPKSNAMFFGRDAVMIPARVTGALLGHKWDNGEPSLIGRGSPVVAVVAIATLPAAALVTLGVGLTELSIFTHIRYKQNKIKKNLTKVFDTDLLQKAGIVPST